MNKLWKKGMCLLFAAAAAVSGCASDGKNVEAESSFKIQVDTESFALSVLTEEESILISEGLGDYSVSDYKQEDNQDVYKRQAFCRPQWSSSTTSLMG